VPPTSYRREPTQAASKMTGDAPHATDKLDHVLKAFELMFESVLADDRTPPDDLSRAKLRRWIERKRQLVAENKP